MLYQQHESRTCLDPSYTCECPRLRVSASERSTWIRPTRLGLAVMEPICLVALRWQTWEYLALATRNQPAVARYQEFRRQGITLSGLRGTETEHFSAHYLNFMICWVSHDDHAIGHSTRTKTNTETEQNNLTPACAVHLGIPETSQLQPCQARSRY